ncbi:MAG: hypothetical protein HC927_07945 [Deltaproteobacteria bacterium]|nr:hypothetical protein [Deltaproteobacteria bacterium]
MLGLLVALGPIAESEVYADDDAIEVLAFDADGEMVGAALVSEHRGEVLIDVQLADGYARAVLGSEPAAKLVETDMDILDATRAVEVMAELAFAGPSSGAVEISKRACLLKLTSALALCGISIWFPTPPGAVPCLIMVADGWCHCGKYIHEKLDFGC